ncbi:MAG: undecaprenyl-phosphate glucose phosphotransferase [Chloroflexota bacterium]
MDRWMRADTIVLLLLITFDVLATEAAFALAYLLRFPRAIIPFGQFHPPQFYFPLMAMLVLTVPACLGVVGLYSRTRGTSKTDEMFRLVKGLSLAVVFAMTLSFFVAALQHSRLVLGLGWLLAMPMVWAGRLLLHRAQASLYRFGLGTRRVLIVGAGHLARTAVQRLTEPPSIGYDIVGLLDPVAELGRIIDNVPVLGRPHELGKVLRLQQVDEVIVAMPDLPAAQLLDMITTCDRERVAVKVLPDILQIMVSEATVEYVRGLALVRMRGSALVGINRLAKRALDLAVSFVVLTLLSGPMLLIALLIKLESPGSVFYIQERVGRDGVSFPVIKFRSMIQDAEQRTGRFWTTQGDPRRTRLGAFLRRFSLDELPQFINVLLGEMSVVGPRPERPMFVEQFRRIVPNYMERHREKAGITGWAQVNGLRGDSSIEERTKYDLYYVENWSILFDIQIMIRTIFEVLRGRAY